MRCEATLRATLGQASREPSLVEGGRAGAGACIIIGGASAPPAPPPAPPSHTLAWSHPPTRPRRRAQVGIDTTCFDLLPRLGGVFSKSYAGLLMTSSSVMTAFSSFSDGKEGAPRHWSGPEYVSYLEAFAAHYGLTDRIRFSTRVLEVRRCGRSGKWLVTFQPAVDEPAEGGGGGGPPGADATTEAFDGVAVCAGAHNWPRAPPLEGAARFGGPVIHSAAVRDMAPFVGKRVAVIGAGESGSDLANLISKVAAAVCIVVRGRHGHLIARNAAVGAGRPNDMNTNRRARARGRAGGQAGELEYACGRAACTGCSARRARLWVRACTTLHCARAQGALLKPGCAWRRDRGLRQPGEAGPGALHGAQPGDAQGHAGDAGAEQAAGHQPVQQVRGRA